MKKRAVMITIASLAFAVTAWGAEVEYKGTFCGHQKRTMLYSTPDLTVLSSENWAIEAPTSTPDPLKNASVHCVGYVRITQGKASSTGSCLWTDPAGDTAIGEFQGIQFMLADMATRTEAARWLTYYAATLADQGTVTPAIVSIAKLFASEALQFVADAAIQIQGGTGYIAENPVGRFYRDARVTRIYEGTSEIQRMVIGRSMLRR